MTKQTIGFDRELNLSWLDLTAGLVQEGLDERQIRQKLLAQLATEVPGEKACKNTVTVLTRIWVRVLPEHQVLQTQAQTLLSTLLPEERLWLHWGMSMLAYPFFYDVAGTVGRLLQLQAACESKQVQRRMREEWGQRTTLERAVSRLLKTFVAWDVIKESMTDPHIYQATDQYRTDNTSLALWFTECLIWSSRQSNGQPDQQLPLAELTRSPAIFPFDLTPHLATLRRSNRFEISRQGLDLEMVALIGTGRAQAFFQ